MKKKILIILLLIILLIPILSRLKYEKESDDKVNLINVYINGNKYSATLENNETAETFIKRFPQEFSMSELNGNEKYIYMNNELPTKSESVKHINSGDIMLYGNDCLVIFYKSFDTSYNYTRIGHIDSLPDLDNGNVNVRFEIQGE